MEKHIDTNATDKKDDASHSNDERHKSVTLPDEVILSALQASKKVMKSKTRGVSSVSWKEVIAMAAVLSLFYDDDEIQ